MDIKSTRYDDPEGYDKRHRTVLDLYLYELWHPFILEKIRKLSPNRNVLDLGCGTCEYIQHINYAKVRIGIDISRDMLEYGAKKLNGENTLLIQGDVHYLPLKSNSIDLIICTGLLEFVELEEAVKECKRVLRENGIIMIAVPNKWNTFNLLIRYKNIVLRGKHFKEEKSIFELRNTLKKMNFGIAEENSFGMVFYAPIMFQKICRYLWRLLDIVWAPFQRCIPLGSTLYLLAKKNNVKLEGTALIEHELGQEV